MGGFLGVTAALDCSHIKINNSGKDDAELFLNRKGFFSINVQAVCDHELNFTNVVARLYGSAHDSQNFNNSSLSVELEEGGVPGILLGDSGYSLYRYLMTPIRNPTRPQHKTQIKTKSCIERCFAVWKRRFPCLNHLRLKLSTILTIIIATSVLHNISRKRADIHDNDQHDPEEPNDDKQIEVNTMSGRASQQAIINAYFS